MIPRPILYSLVRVLLWTALLSILFNGFISIPGLPYNVGELLGAKFSVFQLTFFAIAMIWIGLGSAIVALLIDRSRNRFSMFPLLVALASVVSFMLINASVTGESLADIVGSPTIWRDVVIKRIWGYDAAELLSVVTNRYVVNQLEYAGRFVALYSPVVFMLAAISAGWIAHDAGNWRAALRRSSMLLAYSLPWLMLCKLIVISWAGTDNIVELIEKRAFLGLGGEYLLLLLVLLISFCGALLANLHKLSWQQVLFALAILLLAAPLSWILVKNGLAAQIPKYGREFSALDFLLGANRKAFLSEIQLQMRWGAVYFGALCILVIGISSAPRQTAWK